MIVIADSGSTKTHWVVLAAGAEHHFTTIGMHPLFVDVCTISTALQASYIAPILPHEINEIYFFGAGCSSISASTVIQNGLKSFFPNARCHIHTDLEAAAIATLGSKSGIVSILGTGMSIAFWNGSTIEAVAPSLGYILGDEGSGADLGKRLIAALYKSSLNKEIVEKWHKEFAFSRQDIIESVYKSERPNAFLASFAKFMYANSSDSSIRRIIETAFDEFAFSAKQFMNNYEYSSINSVGSIAFYFKDFVYLALNKQKIHLAEVEQAPIYKLIQHLSNFDSTQ